MIKLSPKQHEVAMLLKLGWSDKGIAKKLGIDYKTVQCHLASVRRKLKVNNRVQLALLLNGIIIHEEEP